MRKVILDCDPGHDDMMAIILACSSPELSVQGITTVAGNQEGEKTFQNALKILNLIGEYNLPVARGFDKPILRDLITAPHIHGNSGLEGAFLEQSDIVPMKEHAVDFIIHTLLESKDKVCLIPTGPLTNVAVSLIKEPEIKNKIERIILMGGAIHDSNIIPGAEFNIYVDPEAAQIVFRSGLPITQVVVDVTNRALFTFKDLDEMETWGGKVSKVVAPLLKYFAQTNLNVFGIQGAPLHDALAVAYAIDPTILITRPYYVEVETKGEFTRGQTVVDVYRITGKEPNIQVAVDLDLEKYKRFIFEAVQKMDKKMG